MADRFPVPVSEAIAAGAMSSLVLVRMDGSGITVVPGAGATMRVYKSTSSPENIQSDLADDTLTYANLIAGTQPTLSTWMLWSPGAVTVTTHQAPIESAGDVAVIATSTGGPGRLEVTR